MMPINTAILLASTSAAKTTLWASTTAAAIVMPTLTSGLLDQVTGMLGIHGTAYVFALVGAIVRWPLFKLSLSDALVSIATIPILAFVLVSIHPEWFDKFIGASPADYPMVFGTIFGLIPNLVSGWVFDFASTFIKLRKEKNAKDD